MSRREFEHKTIGNKKGRAGILFWIYGKSVNTSMFKVEEGNPFTEMPTPPVPSQPLFGHGY